MSDPLGALPHQIPFRALAAIGEVEVGRARGEYLPSGCDALGEGAPMPSFMLIEAMAQLGGAIVFAAGAPAAWLSAIDDASIEKQPQPGDRLTLEVEVEAAFGTMYRFRGRALDNGVETARARFVLALPGDHS